MKNTIRTVQLTARVSKSSRVVDAKGVRVMWIGSIMSVILCGLQFGHPSCHYVLAQYDQGRECHDQDRGHHGPRYYDVCPGVV